jgi:prevent-host-death family protein
MNRTEIRSSDPVVEETGDLPRLIDQVTKEHTRVVLTRDGEPTAALVSMEDYARLVQEPQAPKPDKKLRWDEWFAKSQELHDIMIARRGGKPLDPEAVERAWREARKELEERDSRHAGSGR